MNRVFLRNAAFLLMCGTALVVQQAKAKAAYECNWTSDHDGYCAEPYGCGEGFAECMAAKGPDAYFYCEDPLEGDAFFICDFPILE